MKLSCNPVQKIIPILLSVVHLLLLPHTPLSETIHLGGSCQTCTIKKLVSEPSRSSVQGGEGDKRERERNGEGGGGVVVRRKDSPERRALSLLTLVAAERSTVLSPKSTRSPPRTPALTLFSTLSCFPLACSDALSAFSIRASVADSSGSAEVTVTVRRPEWAWVRVKKSARTEGVRGRRAFWERTERRLVVICETVGRRRFPVQEKRARKALVQG